MIVRPILFFGQECVLACDARCNKAWGVVQRSKNQLSEDEDDYEWLADNELPIAPDDPETYEGRDAKPIRKEDRLNRWCARQCERSVMADINEEFELPDFSKRVSNLRKEENNAD